MPMLEGVAALEECVRALEALDQPTSPSTEQAVATLTDLTAELSEAARARCRRSAGAHATASSSACDELRAERDGALAEAGRLRREASSLREEAAAAREEAASAR